MIWLYIFSAIGSAGILMTFLASMGIVSGEHLGEILRGIPWTRWIVLLILIFVPIVNTILAVGTLLGLTYSKIKEALDN